MLLFFCLHTHLSKIILDVAPGVFSDERLDQTPWLLLVLHTGVNPGATVIKALKADA